MAMAALRPYERNARLHSEDQITRVMRSMQEFGWTMPILAAQDGTVIAGHCRLMAAQRLGFTHAPVMVARGWTDAQRRAYTLADNKLTDLSTWDHEMLSLELGDLNGMSDMDISFTGFSEGELANVFLPREVGKTDAEAEWDGMPDYEGLPPCYRKVVVNFDTPEDVAAFFALIGQDDTGKTKSVWFPEKERRNLEDFRWAGEGQPPATDAANA